MVVACACSNLAAGRHRCRPSGLPRAPLPQAPPAGPDWSRRAQAFHLAFERARRLLDDGQGPLQFLVGRREAGDPGVVAVLAGDHRFPSLGQLVAHAADGPAERDRPVVEQVDQLAVVLVEPAPQPREFVVLRVDVRRHLLEIRDQA